MPAMTGFSTIRFNGFKVLLSDRFSDMGLLEKCCRKGVVNDTGMDPVSSSRYSRVYRFEFGGGKYFYKAFLNRGPLEPLKKFFRGGRAIRAVRGDTLLCDSGFNVPRTLFAVSGRGMEFLVMEAVSGATDLLRLAKDEFPESAKGRLTAETIRKKRLLCDLLGDVTGKLHAKGIVHGDLRWGNILVDQSSPGCPKIWLLDNERTVRRPAVSEKRRVKNLVQLNMFPPLAIGRTDRMRFFRRYLSRCPELLPERKKLARKVLQMTAERLEKRKAGKSAG